MLLIQIMVGLKRFGLNQVKLLVYEIISELNGLIWFAITWLRGIKKNLWPSHKYICGLSLNKSVKL